MLSVHLISGAASVPPLSLALFYKGKHLPNRAIRCAIYATSVYHVNCRLSTVSKICIQLVYKKFTIWRSFPLPAWLSVLSPAPRSCLAGTPPSPLRVLAPQVQPVPLPAQARGCKGRSPLHEITLVSPFPAGEGGRGVRGQESKQKAGAASDRAGKPPAGLLHRRFSPCLFRLRRGDARGGAPCMK